MKRFILSVLCLGVLVGLGYFVYVQWQAEQVVKSAVDVRTDTAVVRDLESLVVATGEVRPLLSSVVKSEISGRITEIFVEEGAAVSRDDALLELDRTSLETRVREAERSYEADALRLEKAERNFLRLKELYAREFVGEQEFLDAETDFALSKLNLEIAQARLEDVEEDLSKTMIRAPHDGLVTRLDVVEGGVISGATSVSNGTELLTVSKMTELFMEANINEVDVERLELGRMARLSFDAIPGVVIEGEVDKIAVSARKEGNVRVFPIEIVFKAEDSRVRPGISATVEMPIQEALGAVSVSLSAVFNEGVERFVFVRVGDGWEKRSVVVGINNLRYVEIVSGLVADDVVALSRPVEFR